MDQNNQPIVEPVIVTHSEKKVGPIVATLIIVLILIIAALYMFASKINQPATSAENDLARQEAAAEVSSTDDVASLEADLDSATAGLEEQNF